MKLPPGDAYLLEQPLEVTLKLPTLKKNNWLRSARIARDEATTERPSTLTRMRMVPRLWIGKLKPSNPGERTYGRTQPKPTATMSSGMDPPRSKRCIFLVRGLRTRHRSKLDRATSSTETTCPPNFGKRPMCATHPETLISETGQRKRSRQGASGRGPNERRDEKNGSRPETSGPECAL